MGLVVRNIKFDGFFKGTFPQVPPPPPAPADQYQQYTVLDLPGTGTNNTANNTFRDSSANNFAITRVGNTTQGSFSPFSTAPGYWSNYFDGSGDTLTLSPNAAFSFGTGAFTIECWVYITAYPSSYAAIATNRVYGDGNSGTWWLNVGSGGGCWFGQAVASGSQFVGSSVSISLNTWTHIAVVRTSTGTNGVSMYFNGVRVGQATITANFNNSSNTLRIGEAGDGVSGWFGGYISNLRMVKGTAVYTGEFTPSTSPLTAVSGTSLLTCQSNRFIDNSSNAFAITRNGDTSVSALGPFVPPSSYDAATMGGSMYFDGSGDNLTIPQNSAFEMQSGDYTVELWMFATSNADSGLVFKGTYQPGESWLPGFGIRRFSGSAFRFYFNTTSSNSTEQYADAGVTTNLNTWNHIAMVVSSGTGYAFVNGQLVATRSNISPISTSNTGITVGKFPYSLANIEFAGYISNLRIVKGTAVYTTNFTPPTAPVSAISGTSLLLNGTNAAIYDASAKNVAETAGDAKISTTISANGSMSFDGSGDYLAVPSNENQQLGTGNFTIETWVRTSSGGNICSKDDNEFVNYGNLIFGVGFNGNKVYFHCNPNPNSDNGRVVLISTSSVTTNQWVHLAITRSGSNWYLFVNGVQEATASSSVGFWVSSSPLLIGCALTRSVPTGFLNGYLNNLRITKGIARYTGNFTPPTRS